jgi:prespore-specific regulator
LSQKRSDAWSPSDDSVLANAVIYHITNGSTQLNAFDEVGERLKRTAAACGFRWNAALRKDYDDQIKEAKKNRQQSKLLSNNKSVAAISSISNFEKLDLDNIIKSLENIQVLLNHKDNEIMILQRELAESKRVDISMNEDYQTLLQIFNRARDLGAISG